MILEKKREEDRALSFEYKAREVPQAVRDKTKFKRMMDSQERKREEAKRLAMAKIKASEAPFAFYERDVQKQK